MKYLIVALAMFGGSVQAQGLRQSVCTDLLDQVRPALARAGLELETMRSSVSNGWCVYSGIEGKSSDNDIMRYMVDEVRLRGDGLSDLAEGLGPTSPLPTRIELQLRHLRFMATTHRASTDLALRAQMRRNWIDLDFLAEWDPTTGTAELVNASMIFDSGDYFKVRAAIDSVNLKSMNALQLSGMGAKLRSVSVEMKNLQGSIFEALFLTALVSAFDDDFDSADELEAHIRQLATAHVSGLPDEVFAAGARQALMSLATDFPNPNGTIEIDFHFAGGFGMADAMRLGAMAAAAGGANGLAPENLTIEASYDRKPLR